MKILYCTDSPLYYKDNRYFALGLEFILERYYKSFGRIVVFCRTYEMKEDLPYIDVTRYVDKVIHSSGHKDAFAPSKALIENLKSSLYETDLLVLRKPTILGTLAYRYARKMRIPLLVELMGDPWDAYWNHGLSGKLIAPYITWQTKRITKKANYAHYVTSEFLQQRYPCKCISVNASNVRLEDMSDRILAARLKRINSSGFPNDISLMTTAAINVAHKGHEWVIKAIPALLQRGINVTYYMAGAGDKARLQKIAQKLGVDNHIIFLGRLSHTDVSEWLDKIDIYIQPSLQEGLPRATIEALSRGCPCLGARTGGIPELLDPECVFDRRSPKDIVRAIFQLKERGLTYYAKRNFERAKEFAYPKITERMSRFYQIIKDELEHRTDK